MLQYLFDMLIILVVSTTKNFTGIALAVYYAYGFWVSVFLTAGGGMAGAAMFTYFSEWFIKFLSRWYNVEENVSRFKTKNRFTKYLISGYGLTAVAVLTPVFLSVPIGSFMAVAMEKNRRRIMVFMLGGFLFWSILLIGVSHLLQLNPQAWVKYLLELI